MKKTLALAAALTVLWTASSWAAATISLNNYDSNNPIFYGQTGTLAPATGTFVELISTQGPVLDTATQSSIIPMSEDGFFFGGVGVVPTLADSATTDFTLRAWRGAATYDAATERGEVTWNQATGSWNPNAVPPAPAAGPALQNPAGLVITVIPEPSTIALGLIGGAALLFFRRK